MKKYIALLLCFVMSGFVAQAQFRGKKAREREREATRVEREQKEQIEEEGHDIVLELDRLDDEWHEIADELGTYAGLSRYCKQRSYKRKVNNLLKRIHHYDTLLYQILKEKVDLEGETHKIKVTIKEIEKVEDKYKPRNFLRKLKDDCKGRHEIERNKKKLKRDVQAESYDGKVLIIDNDIHAYIRRITHLVDLIDKHAHHILDE